MKKIGILPNSDRDINLEYTKTIVNWLVDKGHDPYIMNKFSSIVGSKITSFKDKHDLCRESDFVVVLGGDGTFLHQAFICALYDTPMIGINLGTLGYLTDVDKSDGKNALEKIFKNKYVIERRMMLEAKLEGDIINSHIALNDICIVRGALSKMITVDIMINNVYIDTYKADGIIVSSPSGSTAYNFSAGGPVLKPDLDIIVITPICPHKVYSRSSVVSGEDIVSIKVNDMSQEDVIISIDGRNTYDLKKGQTLNISKSKYYTSIIRTNDLSFYDILREKFSIS